MVRFRSHGFELVKVLSSPVKSNTSSSTTSTRARSTNRPGKRILLVDDDPTVRDSLNAVLQSEGYWVIPAENGQQALDLANKSSVDLVLLDLNMPVKNGWDTFEQGWTANWNTRCSRKVAS